jgi:four helix bundle protein
LSPPEEHFLPPQAGYRDLLTFQKAEVIYDFTFRFAHKFLSRGDRTVDQMVQSARSGKKNIMEGAKASRTSKETEIRLTNIARASLEELLDDYCDFLRSRDLPTWPKDSKEVRFVRRLASKPHQTFEDFRELSPSASSTKPITCWTANSVALRKTFSMKAASVSA